MNSQLIWEIIHNVTLLFALALIYDLIGIRLDDSKFNPRHLLAGFLLGLIGITVMISPLKLFPGLEFDTRSILFSVTGLFFGIIPTLVAAGMISLFRIVQGGSGTWTGVLIIITSGALGILWRYFRKGKPDRIPAVHFYLLGLVVHLVVLLDILTLPWFEAIEVLFIVSPVVLLLFPIITTVLSLILDFQRKHFQMAQALADSENRFRQLYEAESDAILLVDDRTGRILEANGAAETLYQYSHTELMGMKTTDLSAEPEKTSEGMARAQEQPGQRFDIPLRMHRKKDGTVFPVEITGRYFTHVGKYVHIAAIRDITERRQVEATLREEVEALKQAEETLSYQARLLDAISEAIIVTDVQHVIRSWNQAAEQIYGWKAEETIGKPITSILQFQSSGNPIEHPAQKLIREGRWTGESIHHRKDGTSIHVLESVSVALDEAGQPTGYIGVHRDISERVRAEAQIEDAVNYIHTLLEASPIGIVTYRADGPAISANHKAAEIIGVSVEQLLKENFREIPYWKEIGLLDLALSALETGTEQEQEISSMTTAGKKVWLLCRAAPFWHEGQQHLVLMFGDISARKQAEEALEKRIFALTRPIESTDAIPFEELFNLKDIQAIQDAFADISGVASIITRPDKTPITRPSRFCRFCSEIMWGTEQGRLHCLQTEEISRQLKSSSPMLLPCMNGGMWDAVAEINVGGRHIANWIIGQVRDTTLSEETIREYSREIGVDEETMIEAFREAPAMTRAEFTQVAEALYVFAGQLSTLAYQNIQQARFIAERDRAENQIRRLNQELEQRVRDRTAALETANQEMEAFAHSIAHDLRTPLRSILSFSQILQNDYAEALDERGKHYLNRICISAPFMAQLLDDLLRLSNVMRRDLDIQPINLSSMAAEILTGIANADPDRSVTWTIQPNLRALADPNLVRMVLEHLLLNAWKFTSRHSTAQIEFGVEAAGLETVFFVRDDGAGFDMAYVDQLFKPFQRLHTADGFEGTGIGLAMAQRIIQRHGGRIWAEGAVEQGATIRFTLEPVKG